MNEQRIPPRPALSRFVAGGFNRLNTLFDWLYHSEYNPFYRSGTLAIGLLFVLLVTGVYLLFFYSVSAPYESVQQIQQQVWLGRWIRALHRYATDAALIAVFFHVLQLLAHGKTWGPRTLAWVSGVILLLALYISAWTGYVMVWDEHGQLVALAGLELFRGLPILSSEASQAFSGRAPVPASFFFMNLFLHVAIPLGMVFGMWIHTARLARTVWFPIRPVFYGTLAALLILSVAVPAVLPPKANLLRVLGEVPSDWWYGFWIPLMKHTSSTGVLHGFAGLFVLMIAIPWWWRPRRSSIPGISQVDEEGCSGCTQCTRDCPYEAITMVPHPNGKHLLAEVSPIHCVSCGICAASCADLAIGPPGRNGPDQLERIKTFCDNELPENAQQSIIIFGCTHNDSVPQFLADYCEKHDDVHYYGLNCCGTLLTDTFEYTLDRCGGLLLVGCAARNCMNRDGLNLLFERLYGKRVPFLARDIDRKRVVVSPNSENEKSEIIEKLDGLRHYLSPEKNTAPTPPTLVKRAAWCAKRTVASGALMGMLAVLNQWPIGINSDTARVRVVGRRPGQVQLACRPPTAAERASRPAHMQTAEICEQKTLTYKLSIKINGQQELEKTLQAGSIRGDLPVIVFEEVDVPPGEHQLEVKLEPSESEAEAFQEQRRVTIDRAEVYLLPL